MTSIELDKKSYPNNISGWLTLFCTILIFIRPATLLFELFKWYSPWFSIWHRTNALTVMPYLLVVSAMNVAWTGVGAYIGVRIYTLHPQSVNWAKIYLIATFFVSILGVLFKGRNPIPGIIFSLIWYSYLNFSKQVKQLFPNSRSPQLL